MTSNITREAETVAAERAMTALDAEFGTDRVTENLDPERFVSEAEFYAPTEGDLADLAWVMEWEEWQGFHAYRDEDFM